MRSTKELHVVSYSLNSARGAVGLLGMTGLSSLTMSH
jgi:hypothetical protein